MKHYRLILLIVLTNMLLFCCKLETELVVISHADQKVIFKDDFSDDLSKWDIIAGTWGIQNNKLRGVGYVGGIDAWIYAGNESSTDYEISFTAYFVDGNAEIVVRSTGHKHDEYRVELFSQDWGNTGNEFRNTYAFISYKNGEQYRIQDSSGIVHRLCPFEITNPANIKVSIIRNVLKLYINEIFVDSFYDLEPLPAGNFGLGVVLAGECKFDNLVVQEP